MNIHPARRDKAQMINKIQNPNVKKSKIFILGVTGVIGSGKSEFCRFLRRQFDFYWISADKIVHSLYFAGKKGYKIIKKHFGDDFVNKKCVDRSKLREFILKNPVKLKFLNELIHPLVAEEVNKKIVQIKRDHESKNRIFICIEAFYFDKKNLGKFVDQVVKLDATDEIILKRLKNRKILKLQRMLEYNR